jgi:hypothetical protein
MQTITEARQQTPAVLLCACYLLLKLMELLQHAREAIHQHLGVIASAEGVLQQTCKDSTAPLLAGQTRFLLAGFLDIRVVPGMLNNSAAALPTYNHASWHHLALTHDLLSLLALQHHPARQKQQQQCQ